MESLEKIQFNHSAQNIDEAIGLPDGEGKAVYDKVGELSNQTTKISELIEAAINEFSGSHLAFALYTIGKVASESQSPMDMLASMLSGEPCECPDCRAERDNE